MTILQYDEQQLMEKLERLPRPLRVVFAAACAERLLPAYINFSARTGRGDSVAFKSILTRLWDDLGGHPMTDVEVETKINTCMTLIPGEDEEPWVMEQASAEDAGAALAYALTCRQNGKSHEAAWAGRRAYEALDHFVINSENIDTSIPGGEERVLAHPLVQAEFARQRRDLDELRDTGDEDVRQVGAQLRDRARAEATTFFGAPSKPVGNLKP